MPVEPLVFTASTETNNKEQQLNDLNVQERKARYEANYFRNQYLSEGMRQVDASLKCPIVKCGYRKIAILNKQTIDELKSSNNKYS